jgi:hypothetical protein
MYWIQNNWKKCLSISWSLSHGLHFQVQVTVVMHVNF